MMHTLPIATCIALNFVCSIYPRARSFQTTLDWMACAVDSLRPLYVYIPLYRRLQFKHQDCTLPINLTMLSIMRYSYQPHWPVCPTLHAPYYPDTALLPRLHLNTCIASLSSLSLCCWMRCAAKRLHYYILLCCLSIPADWLVRLCRWPN